MVAPTPLQIELVLVLEKVVEVEVDVDVPGQTPTPSIPPPRHPHPFVAPIHQSWYEVTECTLSQANLDSDRNRNADKMPNKYRDKFRYIKDWTKRQSETFLKPTWFNVQGLRPALWGGFWQPRSMVSISSVKSKTFLKHGRFWRSPPATSKWWQCQKVWLMYRLLLGQ